MALTIYEVPLSPKPQNFTIALGVTTYQMRVWWNNATNGGWTLDIADASGVPIVQGIPLVTGANLLRQYAYLGLNQGILSVQTDFDIDAVPTFTNLGQTSHLYFTVVS